MNKKIAILLVLVLLGGSALWAKNFWGFDSNGGSIAMDVSCILLGGGAAAVPFFDESMAQEPYNYGLWGFGGTLALIGIIGLIYDIAVSNSSVSKAVNENPIRNVSFAVLPDNKLYFGARYKF